MAAGIARVGFEIAGALGVSLSLKILVRCHINFISPQNAENEDPNILNRDGLGSFGLPRKQKIGVGFKDVKLERSVDNYGVNFGRDSFWEAHWRNKAEKFAGKIRNQNSLRNWPALFLKFATSEEQIHTTSALQDRGIKEFQEIHRESRP